MNIATNHWDDFIQQRLPTRKDESWKYTPIAALLQRQSYSLANEQHSKIAINITPYSIVNTYRVVFVNGYFCAEYSTALDLPAGVSVLSRVNAATSEEPTHYHHSTVFVGLNQAIQTPGCSIDVAKDIVLKKPIHLLFVNTQQTSALMHHPRHTFTLQANSELTVIEDYINIDNQENSSDNASYFNNIVTEINLAAGAKLTHCKLQREAEMAIHVANTHVKQQRDSQYHHLNFAMGARLSRDDLQIELLQPGANCELGGLYVPAANQHIDFHTRVEHSASASSSRQMVKGIIGDKGHAVFNGQVYVPPNVKQINAEQTNHNLLLGDRSEIDTKPELEIYAEDVKCSHGATIGQLDSAALFYCQSRGIDPLQARYLLMQGFVNELIEKVAIEGMNDYLQCLIKNKLNQLILYGVENE